MKLTLREQAAALGISKSQMANDRRAGCPANDVEEARLWRVLNRRPYARIVSGDSEKISEAQRRIFEAMYGR